MENLENAYIKSLLSKVAYENGIDVGYNFNFLGAEFSNAEREYLNENYEVIGTKHTESGLDLVIFKNLVTGENTICIAGTDIHSAADWGNDLSLGATGIAHKQFIELYNYYQQITHAYGENILQITKLENPSYEPEKPYLRIETAEDEYTYYLLESVENNELPIDEFVAIDANNLSFTGHSLGGHLAGIMSIITGKQATIFNAPSYKENTILSSGCEYVKTDGSIEETTSDFDALICKLLNISNPDSKEGNITHYQNNYGGGFSENIAGSWNSTEEIYCLNGNTNWVNEHSINEIHSTLYAYYVIKDIATGAESFFNNSNLTSPNETFENVYKAYCLNKGEVYQELNYSEYTNINQIISQINEWSETQKTNGGAIKVDSFNHSTSLITGTDGADIIYTGGGNDTVNSGNGNDVVYGIDLDGDMDASAGTTKVINLGAGNDIYHGSNGKDIVSTTGENTENDTNYIYLGAGADIFTGGAGADIVDAGILEKETGIEKQADLGAGNDVYLGGLANDKVNGGSGNNHILLGGGSDEYIGGDDIDIVDGGSGSLKVLNGISGISGKENMTRDITSDKAGDINIINLGGGDDIYYGGKGQDIVDGGSGDDRIYAGDGNNVIMAGSGNDTIEVGRGDNEIHAGTGGDTIKTGVGNNHIYLGNDDQKDVIFVYNIGGYTDHIYEFSSNDYIKLSCDVSSVNYIDNDMIWTLENGAKVHFHNFSVGGEENQTAQEYTSTMDISNADQLIQAMNSFSLSNSASTDTLSDPTQDVSEMYSLAANSDLTEKAV